MDLTRTTIRMPTSLKRAVKEHALEVGVSFQDLVNEAVSSHIRKNNQKKAKKVVFLSQHMGANIDHLTREDYYAD